MDTWASETPVGRLRVKLVGHVFPQTGLHYIQKMVHNGIIQCLKWFIYQELSGFRNHSNGTWYLSSYVINMSFPIYLIIQIKSWKCCILYFVNLVNFNLDDMIWLWSSFEVIIKFFDCKPTCGSIDLLHESQNTPVPNLTMHYFVTKMYAHVSTFLLKNCAFWYIRPMHCGAYGIGPWSL